MSHPQRITRLTPLRDVLKQVDAVAVPVTPQDLSPSEALHCVLAEDVVAAEALPRQPLALHDGYALLADDIADASAYAPMPLPAAPPLVDAGEAMPLGTDCVVPLDAVRLRGERAEVLMPSPPGAGVLPAHGDIAAGTELARRGSRLTLTTLASLAWSGCGSFAVRIPMIRFVTPRDAPDIVSNAARDFIVRALIRFGCDVQMTTEPLAAAMRADSDAVICIGGTGAGRRDGNIAALAGEGKVLVHGVAISPGETAALGLAGTRPVLLLPGRFDAALAAWLTLGMALVARLAGCTEPTPVLTRATLTRKVTSPIGLSDIVPVRLRNGGAEPIASGYWPLSAWAASDGWIMVTDDSEGFAAGSEVVIRRWA